MFFVLSISGCQTEKPGNTKSDEPIENVSITSQEMSGIKTITSLKKYNDKLYLTYQPSPVMEDEGEKIPPFMLAEYDQGKIKEVAQTQYYQGRIYDFVVEGNLMVYSDFDPYAMTWDIVILNLQTSKKESPIKVKDTMPSFYFHDNEIDYYQKNQLMKYNIKDQKSIVIEKFDFDEISLTGQNGILTWQDNQVYYIYDGQLKEIKTDSEILSSPQIDQSHLYSLERDREGAICLAVYDIETGTCQKTLMYADSIYVLKDYIVTLSGRLLTTYDKVTLEKNDDYTVYNVDHIFVADEKECLLIIDENKYTSLTFDK